jgi:hypothetical protein
VIKWLAFPLRTYEILGLNFGAEAGYIYDCPPGLKLASKYHSTAKIGDPIHMSVHSKYSPRVGIACFAYVTSLWVEENKRIYYVNQKYYLRQLLTKYCRWETMFIVWTVYASLFAISPAPMIHLPFTSNGRGTHRFAPNYFAAKVMWCR